MKTERRHDLETNELARRATVWIEKVKPYSAQIVGVIVVLLGLWVVSSVWDAFSASQDEAAWDAYGLALMSADVEKVDMHELAENESYAGTPTQEWAYAAWADRQVYLATRLYLVDRNSALERVKRVVDVYAELAENAGDEQLRNRARFGLARAYELQDKLDEAREHFDQVGGDLQPLARAYAERLLSPDVKETYAWLATVELPRFTPAEAPGNRPIFDTEVPSTTDSTNFDAQTLQDILGLDKDDAAEDRYQGTETPAESGEKSEPATDAGADIFGEDQPADESAAGKPTDDKPVDTAPADDAKQP